MARRLPKFARLLFVVPFLAAAPVCAQETPVPAPAPVEKFGWYGDVTYGPADGKPVYEYMSLTCGHCAHFEAMILPGIKTRLVDTGHVKFVVRNFPLNQLDMAMAVAARCRDEDFARKSFRKLLLEQSKWFSGPQTGQDRYTAIVTLFGELGMEEPELQKCLSNQPLAQHLAQVAQQGQAQYEINATPTILVDGAKVSVGSADDLVTYLQGNHPEIFDK